MPTSIPGIGAATAAVLVAKIVDIDRFQTPQQLVGYFGLFPEQNTSGVDRLGNPLPAATSAMSRKGNDLVRGYLWNAALTAIRINPAIRPLYRRLRASGKRGDVAMGHCMRKLLHLVFAIWKSGRPFDPNHYPWESTAPAALSVAPSPTQKNAVGHKREQVPTGKVVTTATSSVEPSPAGVNALAAVSESAAAGERSPIEFDFLRRQISLERVLRHLGLFEDLKGSSPQRRGRCPFHSSDRSQRTLSVHLSKNVFHCFQADCQAQGNVLDFWAAYHRLPLYEAALHLANTFHLHTNREEAPVKPKPQHRATTAVITNDDT